MLIRFLMLLRMWHGSSHGTFNVSSLLYWILRSDCNGEATRREGIHFSDKAIYYRSMVHFSGHRNLNSIVKALVYRLSAQYIIIRYICLQWQHSNINYYNYGRYPLSCINLNHNVSENEFCLRIQVVSIHFGPTDRTGLSPDMINNSD
jgi:hypothetical protein